MKTLLFVEFMGKQLDENELSAKVKSLWTEAGNKAKDIKTLNLYIKPEESMVYYVINDNFKGCVTF